MLAYTGGDVQQDGRSRSILGALARHPAPHYDTIARAQVRPRDDGVRRRAACTWPARRAKCSNDTHHERMELHSSNARPHRRAEFGDSQ